MNYNKRISGLVFGSIVMMVSAIGLPDTDLTAHDIIQKVIQKYDSLTTYADDGVVRFFKGDKAYSLPFRVKLAKPNLYIIKCYKIRSPDTAAVYWGTNQGDYRDEGNGTKNVVADVTSVSQGSGIEERQSYNRALNLKLADRAGRIGQLFFNEAAKSNSFFFPDENIKREKDELIGLNDCYVLSDTGYGTQTLWIGKKDFLIYQIKTTQSDQDVKNQIDAFYQKYMNRPPPASVPLGNPGMSIYTETHSNIIINQPINSEEFSYP